MKPQTVILAIDQGTTGSSVALFNCESLALISQHSVDFPQYYPAPSWVEHNPEELWQSVLSAIKGALERCKKSSKNSAAPVIAAIGITNQRETTVAWNRNTGAAAGNAVVWQDRRTAEFCETLKSNKKTSALVREKTGLLLDPYFSATKMRWLLRERPEAAELAAQKNLCLGTIDSFLIHRLTGGAVFATDDTNASRTLLYSLQSGKFDAELCALFDVPINALPEIRPSIGNFGVTKSVPGLPDGVPILGCLGDQQAALLGQGGCDAGSAKITFGTGAFLLLNIGANPKISETGLLCSVGLSTSATRTFVLEGSAFIAGAAVQFLRDQFGWFEEAEACEALALNDPRDPNLLFVPALAGLGAPYWNPRAKGALWGMTRGTTRSQIVRAVLESIALQNVQLLSLMRNAYQHPLTTVGVDGGAAQNDMLMQFQADIFQTDLFRPENIETTAKGAAIAAKRALNPEFTLKTTEAAARFQPKMEQAHAEDLVNRWLAAVNAVDTFYRA